MVENEIVIAGGGLAGAIAAITAAEQAQARGVSWLIAEEEPLAELRRNGSDAHLITQDCEDPNELIRLYPRGGQDVLPEFYDFGPPETVAWCTAHGLPLAPQGDGEVRLSKDSPGLAVALTELAERTGVTIRTGDGLLAVDAKSEGGFWVTVTGERTVLCDRLVLAGDPINIGQVTRMAESLGHTIERPVPSFFAFVIIHPLLKHIQHETLPEVRLDLPSLDLDASGSVELHPWGISGEAVLNLSSSAARELANAKGQAMRVKWLGGQKASRLIDERVRLHSRQRLVAEPLGELPPILWENLLVAAELTHDEHWGKLKKPALRKLREVLELTELHIVRKKLHTTERAICGGVSCKEIDMAEMASTRVRGLFFTGDIINVDGFAGGAHRQFHWTSGQAAGKAAAKL